MTRSPTRRFLFALAVTSAVVALMNGCNGCKKPPPPEVDAWVAPPEVDANLDLTDLNDDAGDDASDAAEAGRKLSGGPGVDPNVAKIRACCAAMANQAAHLQNGPEKFQLQNAAAVCNGLAAQVGPGGSAPELAQIRALLAQNKLPNLCAL